MVMKRKAFTLIELLVVIAIVAILSALLFPVFAQAKQAAKKTADLSNMKQLSTAMHMYAGDNDDFTMVKNEEEGYDWYPSLYPYVKNQQVFKTPAYNSSPLDYPTDYLVNGLFAHGLSLSGFSNPSNQINLVLRDKTVEDTDYHPWPEDGVSWDDNAAYAEDGENWFNERIYQSAFLGGANYSFADGHAKFFRFPVTVEGTYPGKHNVDRIWIETHHH